MWKKTLALTVALASVLLAMAAGVPEAWLAGPVRVFALVMLPVALVASLLVLYFDWRSRLRRGVLPRRADGRLMKKAA
jgi:hypothetical protein